MAEKDSFSNIYYAAVILLLLLQTGEGKEFCALLRPIWYRYISFLFFFSYCAMQKWIICSFTHRSLALTLFRAFSGMAYFRRKYQCSSRNMVLFNFDKINHVDYKRRPLLRCCRHTTQQIQRSRDGTNIGIFTYLFDIGYLRRRYFLPPFISGGEEEPDLDLLKRLRERRRRCCWCCCCYYCCSTFCPFPSLFLSP